MTISKEDLGRKLSDIYFQESSKIILSNVGKSVEYLKEHIDDAHTAGWQKVAEYAINEVVK